MRIKDTTLVCIDCKNYGQAIDALKKSMAECTFDKVLFLSDRDFKTAGIETVIIPRINSKEEYSKFVIKELYKFIDTTYMLIIQADGYVLNGQAWDEDWKQYDYIGAPWLETDGFNVGNGGFSFRSKRLMETCADICRPVHPEDSIISRVYRPTLVLLGLKFAPEAVADKFAFELREPCGHTFGFHGHFHEPFKTTAVLKRSGAMGDIIMIEPVIAELLNQGFNVVLDIPIEAWDIYRDYKPRIKHISQFDSGRIPYLDFNLDMVYESNQKRPYLESYFTAVGINNPVLRNSRLYPMYPIDKKLFNKYVVLHIDERPTAYRNVYGIKWEVVIRRLNSLGYHVIQVGAGAFNPVKGAIGMNTPTIGFLKWVIGTADLFIGVDSGPAHLAVAQNVASVIFFGSVTPEKIYADFTRIEPITVSCPIARDGCWHLGTTNGVECQVGTEIPPCCMYDTDTVIDKIMEFNSRIYAPRSN
jgi:hypothetical protein